MASLDQRDNSGGASAAWPAAPAACAPPPAPDPAPALAPGTVVGDQFRITGVIGAGGMGVVYAAQHLRLPRWVAVKVLHPHMVRDAGALARFWREATNACSISSPHVAAVYDFGPAPDGAAYLAMEYVAGCTLRDLLAAEGPLAPARVAELVRQIAAGLDAAHALGIVHRDLTPANVMVTRDAGGREQVKLVDFGIAKVADDERQAVTEAGFVTGTREFMSPEQITGARLDHRSDVYTLGLLTFLLLTGGPAFVADTPTHAMLLRLTEPPRTLAAASAEARWPPRLQAALDTALARDPAARFASAGAFAEAVGAALADAVAASPTSAPPAAPEPAPLEAAPPEPPPRSAPWQPAAHATPAAAGTVPAATRPRARPRWLLPASAALACVAAAAGWRMMDAGRAAAHAAASGETAPADGLTARAPREPHAEAGPGAQVDASGPSTRRAAEPGPTAVSSATRAGGPRVPAGRSAAEGSEGRGAPAAAPRRATPGASMPGPSGPAVAARPARDAAADAPGATYDPPAPAPAPAAHTPSRADASGHGAAGRAGAVLDRVQRMLLARSGASDSAAIALVLIDHALPDVAGAADSARALLFRGEAHAIRGACAPARAAFTAAKQVRGPHGAVADRYIAALSALDCE